MTNQEIAEFREQRINSAEGQAVIQYLEQNEPQPDNCEDPECPCVKNFEGIPRRFRQNNPHECSWFGDDAKFIVANWT